MLAVFLFPPEGKKGGRDASRHLSTQGECNVDSRCEGRTYSVCIAFAVCVGHGYAKFVHAGGPKVSHWLAGWWRWEGGRDEEGRTPPEGCVVCLYLCGKKLLCKALTTWTQSRWVCISASAAPSKAPAPVAAGDRKSVV